MEEVGMQEVGMQEAGTSEVGLCLSAWCFLSLGSSPVCFLISDLVGGDESLCERAQLSGLGWFELE